MQGAPTAGDKFNVLESEVEAREIANKRLQLQREQGLRTQKHITLDEIGRRLAVGNFKELNIIVKGDVDGSIEALSDSLLKLSTEQIQVNIISKAVGQISESDVLLASASDAIIIGFQVRPSGSARKLAEAEQIDIRLYSIIYDAINEIKAAMEGMLAPTFEEKIVANVEIRETFKISKVGTIADISWVWYLPPHSSTKIFIAESCSRTLSALAPGLSILLKAKIIGAPAACAWFMASRVCGITLSSAAITIITISVTCAPLARMAVNAS